jgi:glucosamine 6-phosphate synthetase-like amidotransferase/phosphosugar isomerase protein
VKLQEVAGSHKVALKIKSIVYLHAEEVPAGEIEHGTSWLDEWIRHII